MLDKKQAEKKLEIDLHAAAVPAAAKARGARTAGLWLAMSERGGLVGSSEPAVVFALARQEEPSGQAAAKFCGWTLSAWDLNKADALESRPQVPFGTHGEPVGLQCRDGRLFTAFADGTVNLHKTDLSVERSVDWKVPMAATGSIDHFVMLKGTAAFAQKDGQLAFRDVAELLPPAALSGRWRLSGQTHTGAKYEYDGEVVHDFKERISGAGLAERIGDSTITMTGRIDDGSAYVALGTYASSPPYKCEWLHCVEGYLPSLVEGEGHDAGHTIKGKWRSVSLESLSTPQLSTFYEAHVGEEAASAMFRPEQIQVQGKVCDMTTIAGLSYPDGAACICDVCGRVIASAASLAALPLSDAGQHTVLWCVARSHVCQRKRSAGSVFLRHEGALTGGFDVCLSCARKHAEISPANKAALVVQAATCLDQAKVAAQLGQHGQLPCGEFILRRLMHQPTAQRANTWVPAQPPKARPTALRQVWNRVPKESPHSCLLASADGSSFFAAEVGSIAPAQLQVAGASAAPRVWVWNAPW